MMTLPSPKVVPRRMANIPIILLLGAFFIGLPFQSNAQDNFDNTDLPGQDFGNFNLGRSAWEDCKKACFANGRCMSWTYVRPGFQGPNPRCWLKSGFPAQVRNPCCISGMKHAMD
jgi:PAN domain